MKRDWSKFSEVYDELVSTHYPQPEDPGHTELCEMAVDWFMSNVSISSVIDAGCGWGMAQHFFQKHGVFSYKGLALGEDVEVAKSLGRDVVECDFNFIPEGLTADAILSRHSLEHSLFPHITLNLWKQVAKFMFLVVPAYEWVHVGTRGSNHFNVLDRPQWEAVFTHADLSVEFKTVRYHWGSPDEYLPDEKTPYEYWWILKAGG
jgi:hypothetical protein